MDRATIATAYDEASVHGPSRLIGVGARWWVLSRHALKYGKLPKLRGLATHIDSSIGQQRLGHVCAPGGRVDLAVSEKDSVAYNFAL